LLLPLLVALIAFPGPSVAVRGRYARGDWVSWTAMRHANAIIESENILYLATDGGIARYSLTDRRWLAPLTVSDGLIGRRVQSMYIDRRDLSTLVYMTGHGRTGVFNLLTERDDPSSAHPPVASRPDIRLEPHDGPAHWSPRQGPLWQGIPPDGFTLGVDGTLTDEDLRRYQTIDSVIDFWDNMWLAVRGLGLVVRDWETARMRVLQYSLWDDRLAGIDSYGDNFWFVGPHGINVHNRDLDAWARFEAFKIPDLIAEGARDVLVESTMVWLATSAGLSRYDGSAGKWRTFTRFDDLPDNDVRCLAADSTSVWIGTAFGPARLDRATGRVEDVSEGDYSERGIRDVCVSDGTVWVATDAGLRRSADGGRTWRAFGGGDRVVGAPVSVIEADGETIWFASSRGVAGYETSSGSWEEYPRPHYFGGDSQTEPPLHFLSLLPQGNLVWVGTDRGVFRCDRRRNYVRRFTTDDGLIDNRVMDIEIDEDYIWFATPSGATRFRWDNPDRVD